MISRVYADNYRCLVNFDLEFERVSLLLGANGSGKSACLDVMAALRRFVVDDASVDDLFPGSCLTRWDQRTVQTFGLTLDTEGGRYEYHVEIEHDLAKGARRVGTERLTFNSTVLFSSYRGVAQLYRDDATEGPEVVINWRRSGVGNVPEGPHNKQLVAFRTQLARLYCFNIDPLAIVGISDSEAPSPASDLRDFVSWYRHLSDENPAAISDYFGDLAELLPGFKNLRLTGTAGGRKQMQIVFATDQSASSEGNVGEYAVGLEEASYGQRALIALYAILRFASVGDATICMDEPDNYVALREIQPWLVEAEDRADEQTAQFILVSHHPEAIDRLARDAGVLFTRAPGGPARTRRLTDDETANLSVSELIARGRERRV